MTKQKHRRANFPIKTKLEAVKLWISCKKSGPEICEEFGIDLSSLPRWRDALVSKGLLNRDEAYPFRMDVGKPIQASANVPVYSEAKVHTNSSAQVTELQTQVIQALMENAKLRTEMDVYKARIEELESLLNQRAVGLITSRRKT